LILLDIKVLKEKLIQMEEDKQEQDARKLRQLLGFLGGDKKILRKLSLEEIAEMFNDIEEILKYYREEELPFTRLEQIPAFVPGKRRRAL